ncbi:MAG: hypothetical protein IT232_10630 [Flavobacteriales bacterium]|nr:hypothetical protein [Flavobacteriales bacterium]
MQQVKQFELIDYAIDPLNIKTVTAVAGASTNLFYHSTFSFIRDGQTRQGDMDIIIGAGQKIRMDFINHNLLGATISVNNIIGSEKTWLGAIVDKQITKNIILLPTQTKSIEFSNFGNEPMQWKFSIGTISEATNVSINIYSTWVPGMPSNPPLIPRLSFPFIPIKP